MGQSPSKRVAISLRTSPDFTSSCNTVYADCLSLAQHAFPGVKPYQLVSAADHLHRHLFQSVPIVSRWVPNPPDRAQVDRALKTVLSRRAVVITEEEVTLDEAEFMEFAVEVFVDAVVSGARREVMRRVPIGVVGIGIFGAVARPGAGALVAAVGMYGVGVATAVYLSLDGG